MPIERLLAHVVPDAATLRADITSLLEHLGVTNTAQVVTGRNVAIA